MAITHVTEATVGAPNSGRISGTAGDLGAMLAYAVGLQGWATEFSGSNIWVLRPATGNRFRLWVQDDGTVSGTAGQATVRGVESATSTTSVTNPFPTVAAAANNVACWSKSSAVSSTARNFDIFVGDTWVMYFVNLAGSVNVWDFYCYGDMVPSLSGDPWNTICSIKNSTTLSNNAGFSIGAASGTGTNQLYWARSYDGTVKSTTGSVRFLGGSLLGTTPSQPTMQNGPSTKIDREKTIVADSGATTTAVSSSLALPSRGYFPNLWIPQHGGRGAVNTRDDFTDTAYSGSAAFLAFTQGNAASGNGSLVVETTPTWSAPVG